MIDPIKKFVEENREAFDHREPPVDALKQIKERLKARAAGQEVVTRVETRIVPFFRKAHWLVAASILLAVTVAFIVFNKRNNPADLDKLVLQHQPKTNAKITVDSVPDIQKKQRKAEILANIKHTSPIESEIGRSQRRINADSSKKEQTAGSAISLGKDMYARLADSSSSTMRLSAILEIGKSNRVNLNTLDLLAKTLNNDSNSNVRLAALDVISKYAFDEHASSLLVGSLSTQNDPLVQLGLISILGKLDNVKIDDRLFALADDPNTFSAVKEEAYVLLLNQNKL